MADAKVAEVFVGEGEMATRCRAFDWSATPLGPVESWSHSLRTTVGTLLASRHPMFLWWGPELVQIYNDAYRPSLGEGDRHPRALGARGRDFWTDIWDAIGPQIAQVMSGGAATWHEDQYLPIERNGRTEDVWWTYGYSPVRDDDGCVGGTLVVCQETTARVRAFAERDRLLESMTDAFAAFDDEWRYTFVNAAAERLLGRSRDDLLGRVVWDVFPEAREGPAWDNAQIARYEQRVSEYEFLLSSIGKQIRARNYPLPGGGVAAVFSDVTAERRAAMERDRLAGVMESSADFIGVASPDGQAIHVNEAGRRMVGLPDMDAVRRTRVVDYFFPEDRAFFEGTILPGMQAGRWKGETRFRHFVTGASVPVLYDAFRVTDPRTGALIGYGTVTRDLTERDQLVREAERARADAEDARAEAEAANRAKSEFLAVMSHELRTPLNAIGGYAELLELGIRGPVTPEQRQDLARIQKSQRHLLGLINEVLNYTRVERGAVTFQMDDVLLDETLAACEALTAPQMRAKRLEYHYGGCDPRITVRADAEKVQQIVLNLLTNAIKFTEPGGAVRLDCDATDDSVTVAVRDTGRGISPEQFDRVFEPFVQVDARLTRTKEGVGLGLAISRDLARGMGGDLTVESQVGVGSVFRLVLPRSA
ncbi:MAG TPA: ATP-binding protein [Gemmatimonadaceae bacterium]|nr:ATP-binding protein [Gemmatimonadaceae bacterium]